MNTLVGWLTWEVAQGVLRNMLLAAGTSLVAGGYLTNTDLSTGVGAVITIVSVVLSAISNRQKAVANATVAAVQAHPQITVTPAAQSGTGKPVVTVRPELPPKSISGV